MSRAIDLDAYFSRIDYTGPATPRLETLTALHLRHAVAIPFENLNPLLQWPVRLDLESLEQKLVMDGRGGYCFEHNILFSHALRRLGFDVRCLAARVMANAPSGVLPARTHMLLLVIVDSSPYVADVGFGGLTLTGPLRLISDVEQTTPHEPFRLIAAGDEYMMQARFGGAWNTLYRFGLHEQLLPDYEVTNWYLSHHPESKFVTTLIAARPDTDRRYALRNNNLSVHHLDGRTEQRVVEDGETLREVLRTAFRVNLPESREISDALHRVVMQHTVPAGGV